jgi:hypothetical protein
MGTRIRRDGVIPPPSQQRNLASLLFARRGALFLGPRIEVGRAQYLYWEVKFEHETQAFRELRAFLEQYVETPSLGPDNVTRLRDLLLKDAWYGFLERLHDDSHSYVDLELEIRLPESDKPQTGSVGQPAFLRHAAISYQASWGTFAIEHLIPPDKSYILRSVSGAGKTTFLRHLQITILDATDRIPIYCRAEDAAELNPLTWPRLATSIVQRLDREDDDPGLLTALREAFTAGQVVFLVDALDTLGQDSLDCSSFVSDLRAAIGMNPTIFAGRPTVTDALRVTSSFPVFRLCPFSPEAQVQHFGDHLQRASSLCGVDIALLHNPMLAYVLRTVLSQHDDVPLPSRWHVYTEFVKHIVDAHQGDRRRSVVGKRSSQSLQFLAEVSYRGIAREHPVYETIPQSICASAARRHHILPDDVAAAGLVELIKPPELSPESTLRFVHASFQEYFAALWIRDNPHLINRVLDEYWDRQWEPVLTFLAAACEVDVVDRLLDDCEVDTPLYSRLFLAATCAGQTEITRQQEIRLVDAIWDGPLHRDLMQSPYSPFNDDALRALISIGTERALDAAWRCACTLVEYGVVVPTFWDSVLFSRLYSPDRVEKITESVEGLLAGDDPLVVKDLLPHRQIVDGIKLTWVALLPEKQAVDIVDRAFHTAAHSLTDWHLEQVIMELAPHLEMRHLFQIESDKTVSEERRSSILALLLPWFLGRLEQSDLQSLVNWAIERYPPRRAELRDAVTSAFVRVQQHMNPQHRENLMQRLGSMGHELRPAERSLVRVLVLGEGMHAIACHVEDLRSESDEKRVRALEVLSCMGDRINDDACGAVIDCLDCDSLRTSAIGCIGAFRGDLESSLGRRLSGFALDGDRGQRRAALRIVERWQEHATEEHVESLLEALRRREDPAVVFRACVFLFDRFEPDQLRSLGELLIGEDDSTGWAIDVDDLAYIVGRLPDEQIERVVNELARIRQIGEKGKFDPILHRPRWLIRLCDPMRVSERGIDELVHCMEHGILWVRMIAYDQLKRVHEAGRLRSWKRQ